MRLEQRACDADRAFTALLKFAAPGSPLLATDAVECYAKNDHLGLQIPYDLYGVLHMYVPDFLVTLRNDQMLLLETKGWQTEPDRAKYAGAERWVQAVNNWLGGPVWLLRECRDPQMIGVLVRGLAAGNGRVTDGRGATRYDGPGVESSIP